MQKKLIAVAVAGALAAPVLAFAQASTVQIYGQITLEYGKADQGNGRPSVDYADTPGGSAIGFKGEEKLGGGLSAWFQCETSADIRGVDSVGLCSRNSAVGFKGGFGNVYGGKWDTPMKRALNVGTVGAEETGILGMSFLPFGGSGGADISGTGSDSANRQRWKRRESNLFTYESPNFSGFQVMGAFTSAQRAADLPATNGTLNAKPRVLSLAGTYTSGPLGLGLAYEKHSDTGYGGQTIAATSDVDDSAWGISAAYTFAGKVKVGATYLAAEWDTLPGQTLKKDTFTIGVDWAISGPHSFEAQYGNAGDSKGNSTAGITGNGGAAATGSATGGDQFSLAYRYRFSKRTSIKLAWVKVDNDSNTNTYRIGNTGSIANGESVDAYGFHIRHRF